MATTGVVPASVVITGGASGIGAAVARRVAAAGGAVGLVDVNEAGMRSLAKELGADCHWAVADCFDEGQVEAAHASLMGRLPPIDGLVACAGIAQVPTPIKDYPVDKWERILLSHAKTTYVAARVFGPAMCQRGQGAMVAISSVLAFRPGPVLAYGPGKAAIASLTESLAVEWGWQGVRVNAVAPGWTETPFLFPPERQGYRDMKPILRAAPAGRLLQAGEIAEVIYFLLSPAASAVNGAVVPCDGGMIAGTGWHAFGGVPHGPDFEDRLKAMDQSRGGG